MLNYEGSLVLSSPVGGVGHNYVPQLKVTLKKGILNICCSLATTVCTCPPKCSCKSNYLLHDIATSVVVGGYSYEKNGGEYTLVKAYALMVLEYE